MAQQAAAAAAAVARTGLLQEVIYSNDKLLVDLLFMPTLATPTGRVCELEIRQSRAFNICHLWCHYVGGGLAN